jgi:hypothetical protein
MDKGPLPSQDLPSMLAIQTGLRTIEKIQLEAALEWCSRPGSRSVRLR